MKKRNWYKVVYEGNFYDDMTGECVGELEKIMILDFKFNEKLGGTQRVAFFKEQLIFEGTY